MVIDHPDRLHVRVDDRRTDEAEASAFEIPAHGVRLGAARRDLPDGSPAVLERATFDEPPLVRIEAAELVLHLAHGVKQLARARSFFVERRVRRDQRAQAHQLTVNGGVVQLRHTHGFGDRGQRARVHLGVLAQIQVVAGEAQHLDQPDQRLEQAAPRVFSARVH